MDMKEAITFWYGCNALRHGDIIHSCLDILRALDFDALPAGGPDYCCGSVKDSNQTTAGGMATRTVGRFNGKEHPMDYTHLTFEQRYHIELGRRKGLAREGIARRIGVNRSTVYRELDRGQDPDGGYHAVSADERARAWARSSAANHPVKSAALWHWVSNYLRQGSSPDQVVGRLGRNGTQIADAQGMCADAGTPGKVLREFDA